MIRFLLSFCLLFSIFTLPAQTFGPGQDPTAGPDTSVNLQDFIAKFPPAGLPYAMSPEALIAVTSVRPRGRLDYPFYQFMPSLEALSTASGKVAHPYATAFFDAGSHLFVLYDVRLARTILPHYVLDTYDETGQYIGSHTVGSITPEKIYAFVLRDSLTAEVTAYPYRHVGETTEIGMGPYEVAYHDLTHNSQSLSSR